MKNLLRSSRIVPLMMIILILISSLTVTAIFAGKAYSTEPGVEEQAKNPEIVKWGFFSAALATGLSTIAAAIAVGLVGSSAMGAMSEQPEMAGRALIFVGLAEGIAIYGLIIAIMILGKV